MKFTIFGISPSFILGKIVSHLGNPLKIFPKYSGNIQNMLLLWKGAKYSLIFYKHFLREHDLLKIPSFLSVLAPYSYKSRNILIMQNPDSNYPPSKLYKVNDRVPRKPAKFWKNFLLVNGLWESRIKKTLLGCTVVF